MHLAGSATVAAKQHAARAKTVLKGAGLQPCQEVPPGSRALAPTHPYPPHVTKLSRAVLCARQNASGRPRSRSVATIECSPTLSNIPSPDEPCRCTAAHTARITSLD